MSEEDQNLPAVWQPRELTFGDKQASCLVPDQALMTGQVDEPVVSADNVDIDDMLMPELRLCQNTTAEVQEGLAKPGQYVLTSTGEVFDPPLQVLLIHHSKGRALFPNPSKGSGHLEMCLSQDTVTGTRYGDCMDCPHKEWPTEEDRAANPNITSPFCSLQHNFIVMTHRGPAVLRFGRTSRKAAEKFLTGFKFSRANLWANVCVVRAKRKTKQLSSGDSTYYTHELYWDPQDAVPESMRKGAMELFSQLQALHESAKLNVIGEDHEDQ